MRYLGLDVGEKTIGVAVGETLASELTTLRTKGSFYRVGDRRRAITELLKISQQEECDAIVVGLPVSDDGRLTAEAKKIRRFAEVLEKVAERKIHYVNETLTSFMAEDILEGQGLSLEQAKEREDQLAAQLILQQFLEGNERT